MTPFNPIFCFHCRSPNEGGEPQVSPRALIQGCRFQTALLREQFTTVLSTPKLNAHLSRLSGGLLLAPRGPCASQRKGWRCPRPPDVRMEIVCGQEGLGGSPQLGGPVLSLQRLPRREEDLRLACCPLGPFSRPTPLYPTPYI